MHSWLFRFAVIPGNSPVIHVGNTNLLRVLCVIRGKIALLHNLSKQEHCSQSEENEQADDVGYRGDDNAAGNGGIYV